MTTVATSIITLITDFGTTDGYAGAMKGVILGINPRVTIVDITHDIQPQNIFQAAYVLKTCYPHFPKDTIHLVVVDPEVGTERRAIAMKTPYAYFVAPDNGLVSYVAKDMTEAVSLTNRRYWREPVSSTFHGRDIFAPVAAQISLGTSLRELGESVSSLELLPIPEPVMHPDGTLVGHVIHIDRFGNLITDIEGSWLSAGFDGIDVKGYLVNELKLTYAEGDGLLALIGSEGNLELGIRNGSAASLVNARWGDPVVVTGCKGRSS